MTKCITEGKVGSQGWANVEANREKCLKYDFRFIEDFRETGWGSTVPSRHPLAYMVSTN